MTCSISRGTTSEGELDTILQFAEESSTKEIFTKETELTQTWLSEASQNESPQKFGGTETRERSQRGNVVHTSVDIKDSTTKRPDSEEKNHEKSKNRNIIDTLELGNDVNEIQEIEKNISVDNSKRTTLPASTDEGKRALPTKATTAGASSTSCEGQGGRNDNDPVVAKVHRDGPSSSCNCSYFCQVTGIMKIFEITSMLLALIITVCVDGAGYYSNSVIIVNGVLLMSLTVTPTLLVCYLLKQTPIQRTLFECIINAFLALYSIVAGCSALSFVMNSSSDNVAVGIVLGLLLIIAGIAYAVDCGLAVWKYRD